MALGPLAGVALAGAALYATTRPDDVGNVARATGNATVKTYDAIVHTAEKHHVGEKISEVTAATCRKAQEINEEYHVTDKLSKAAREAASSAKALDEKYHISDKATKLALKSSAAFMSGLSKLASSSSSNSTSNGTSSHI